MLFLIEADLDILHTFNQIKDDSENVGKIVVQTYNDVSGNKEIL